MATNKEQVVALLKEKGYSDAAIAGIIGNIDVETGGTFDFQQKQKKGSGYGLFQFDFLKKYYNKWLENNNLEDSAKSQVDFFHDTVYGNSKDIIGQGTALKVQSALQQNDPELIASDVSDLWLKPGKPHTQRRINAALSAFDSLAIPAAPTNQPVESEPQGINITEPIGLPDLKNKEDIKRVQKAIGVKADGVWGPKSKEAWKQTNDLFVTDTYRQEGMQRPAPKSPSFLQRAVESVIPSAQAAEVVPQQPEPQYATMEDLLMDRGLMKNPLLFDDVDAERMWRQF